MRRLFIAASLALALAGVVHAKQRPTKPARPSLATRYPAAIVQGFMNECTKQAGSIYCGCAILKIQARYSLGDYMIFTGQMLNGNWPPQLTAVALDCAPQRPGTSL